jgi:hypothetical protein
VLLANGVTSANWFADSLVFSFSSSIHPLVLVETWGLIAFQ